MRFGFTSKQLKLAMTIFLPLALAYGLEGWVWVRWNEAFYPLLCECDSTKIL